MVMARATLFHDGVLHVCEGTREDFRLWTPALGLIYGVYERFQTRAHFALRKPIELDYPPSRRCLAAIKVGAKRWKPHGPTSTLAHASASVFSHPLVPDASVLFAGSDTVLGTDCGIADALLQRLRRIQESAELQARPRYERPRPVCALLLGAEGNILLEAWNSNAVNRICHAELNLLHQWWALHGRPPPVGSVVAVSLKPCRMCAALLFESTCHGGQPPIEVRYLEEDKGPFASGTAYDTESEAKGRMRRLSGSIS